MRKLLSAVILIGFYTAFALAIAEVSVRVAGAAPPAEPSGWFWQVPHGTTGWALLPNSSGRAYDPLHEYNTHFAVNSRGLRAPESLTYEKPDGIYRVMVLGDSFVEAVQVEYEEMFGQRLGRLLEEQTGQPVQVINAGVGGWGTDQQLLWLKEEGYKYQPDLILLAVYPRNDFMNNYEPLETANQGSIAKPFFTLNGGELQRKYWPFDPSQVPAVTTDGSVVQPEERQPGPLTAVGEWLHDRSAFYRYADPRLRIVSPRFAAWLARTGIIQPGQESKLVAQGQGYVPLAYNVYRRQWDADWEEAYTLTQAIFAETKETATGMGAQTGAVLITAPEQVYESDWQSILTKYPEMQSMDLDLAVSHQRAAQALAEAEIPTLDLLELFRTHARTAPRLHLKNDGHWTPEGHKLAARATVNFLAETGMVPPLAGQSVPVVVAEEGRSIWEWIVLAVLALLAGSLLWDVIRTGPLRWGRKVAAGLGTTGELLAYLARRRQYTLLPLVVVLLMFAGLLILAQASVVGPFIYTLI